MALSLSSLLVEFLLELFNLSRDFLLSSNNIIILGFFPHEIPTTILNFISYLLIVLEVHLFDLAISSLYVVTEFVRDGFLAKEC